ncbi:MAG: O-antigen ligase family protein [Myxococcota bacterium]
MESSTARIALAAGAALAAGLLAFVHPAAPLLVLVAAWALAYGISSPFVALLLFVLVLVTRPAEFVPALARIHPAKIAALLALALFVVSKLARRDISWATMPHNRWVVVLTIIAFASIFLGTGPRDSMQYFTDVFVKILILYFLVLNLVDGPRRAVAFQVVFAVGTAFLGAYAIWSQLTGHADIEGSRAGAVGMLGDPNDLALTLLIPLPFLVLAVGRARGLPRVAILGLLALTAGGILATQSRGGLLAVAASGYLLLRLRFKSRVLTWGAVAAILVGLIAVTGIEQRQGLGGGGLDESAQGRLDAWIAGYRMLRWNPLSGVGLDRFVESYPAYVVDPVEWRPKAAHNSLVQAAAETGIFGAMAFCMLLFVSVRSAWRLYRAPGRFEGLRGAVVRAQLPSLIGLLVAASFLSQAWNWFLYITIAFIAAVDRVEDPVRATARSGAESRVVRSPPVGVPQPGPGRA